MEEKFMQVMDKLDILLHPIESLKETGYELLILIEKFSFNNANGWQGTALFQ